MNKKILYHATYMPYLDSIIKYGIDNRKCNKLNWSDSKIGVNYLSIDADIAESYAEESESVPDSYLDKIIILKIDASQLDEDLMMVDENVLENDGSTLQYCGVIPSSAIINKVDFRKKKAKRKAP